MSLCAEKIVSHWFELRLIDDSDEKRFTSRLVVVRKKIPERDSEMISKSVSDQMGKPVKITDPKQVYLIDPDLLESDLGIIAKRDISNVPPEKRRHIYSLLDICRRYSGS